MYVARARTKIFSLRMKSGVMRVSSISRSLIIPNMSLKVVYTKTCFRQIWVENNKVGKMGGAGKAAACPATSNKARGPQAGRLTRRALTPSERLTRRAAGKPAG